MWYLYSGLCDSLETLRFWKQTNISYVKLGKKFVSSRLHENNCKFLCFCWQLAAGGIQVVCECVRDHIPLNSCEHKTSQIACRNLTKFTTWVQMGTKMNWYFEVKGRGHSETTHGQIVHFGRHFLTYLRNPHVNETCHNYSLPSLHETDDILKVMGLNIRAVDNRTCLVKRSRNQFGDRCFATVGPTLWNSLPEQLWQPDITLRTIQTIVENVFVWLVGLQRLVSER